MSYDDIRKKYGLDSTAVAVVDDGDDEKAAASGYAALREKFGLTGNTASAPERPATQTVDAKQQHITAGGVSPSPTGATAEDYDTELDKLSKGLENLWTRRKLLYKGDSSGYISPGAQREIAALDAQIEKAERRKSQLEGEKKYNLLSQNADFVEKSKATGSTITAWSWITGEGDAKHDFINGYDRDDDARHFASSRLYGLYGHMTEDEKANYNYLYNTAGKDSAEAYLDHLKNELSARQSGQVTAEWSDMAKKLPVQTSVMSVPMNLWGVAGSVDALGQQVKNDITGNYYEPVNYNSAGMMPSKITTAIRGTVAQNLANEYGVIELDEEKHPVLSRVLNGKSLGDVYQLGMSMADSAATAAMTAVLGVDCSALLGGSAATQSMLSAVEKGASDEQALAIGALSGAFEWIFEKYELEHLLGADTNIVKAVANQAMTEALGEGGTSIANMVANALVMAEKSDWQASVDDYLQNNPGMTEQEAKKQAFLDAAISVGWDMTGGALSGGIMGGGTSAIKNVSDKASQPQGAALSGTNVQSGNGQATQETAAEPAPWSPEWVKETLELGKSVDARKKQRQQADGQMLREVIEETLGLKTNTSANATGMQTNAVSKPLSSYPAEKQNMIRSYIQAADEKLKSFVQRVKSGDLSFRRQKISDVSDRAATDIENLLGVDVRGYTHNINTNGMQHILNRHGENGKQDKTMSLDDDIARVGWVLENYDSVELLTEGGKPVYSSEFLDKNHEKVPQIRFTKKIDGSYYVVEAAFENNYKKLWVQSAYLQKKEDVTQSLAEGQATNHETNARSAIVSPSSNNNIPQDGKVVNTSAEESVGAATAGTAQNKVAEVLTDEPQIAQKKKRNLWSWAKEKVFDKGMVFETLALKTKNRELQAKWNSTRYAQSRAQWLIGNGAENTKSLNAIRDEVEKTGKTKQFFEYLYHRHNIDRMQLEARFKGVKNKPVFGDAMTAEDSRKHVEQYERENPSFKQLAEDVYAYMNHLRQLMVDNGIITKETADLWAQMYPNYVPIRRDGKDGRAVEVPLDTGRTGVNAPVKKATGGNSDILNLFNTMAQRTLQTYTAIARNSFGVELKNTLGTVVAKNPTNVDEAINSVDTQEELLQKGKSGTNPTFTVFENGERVTFEVTDEMYDALKPVSDGWAYTIKAANAVSNFRRGVLTEYNPTFLLTNAIKDVQDVFINSQHPVKTYAKIPQAYVELAKKGKWYTEYVANGGDQNTYFDRETNTFEDQDKRTKKLTEIPPLSTISELNRFIEMAPRLAEYIASREAGRSIDVSMLDAARVTTNFAAGGDLTKLLNRNGATFLNASVQGAVQQFRNLREAKWNGPKGWAGLAARFVLAGLPAALLNGLIWDDDEDYAELSDYVKDNYYCVWKYGDGQFVRIPKGRTVAVIQNAFTQVCDAVTGDDELDLGRFLELIVDNLAPSDPSENNIISPIRQVMKNKTWYGEDLVPSRLQDLPAAEQYDESTDALSKWLGEKLNISPVKINYLLDQYSGGIGDVILPMMTPEAESGDNSLAGNLLAPLKDKFTTDSVMNNQNVTDFYDKVDELTTNAKASTATVEDKILYKYINSVNSQLRDLYAEKRKVQSSDLPDDQKYARVRSIQQKITDAAQTALGACSNPYSADKSGMVVGVIDDSLSELRDCWKNGADTAVATDFIEKAYEAYTKMDGIGKENVKAEGGRVTDYLIAKESGIATETFVGLYKTFYDIDNNGGNATAKASQWSYALEKAQEQGTITAAQKNALKKEMNFWQMIPAETVRFDNLTDSGMSADKSSYIVDLVAKLKPETGKSTVRTVQQVEAIADADDKLTEAEKKKALKTVLDDDLYEKYLEVLGLKDVRGANLDTGDYADSYRAYLEEKEIGGKGTKARTIKQFQQDFGLSYDVAKQLYEIYNPK